MARTRFFCSEVQAIKTPEETSHYNGELEFKAHFNERCVK